MPTISFPSDTVEFIDDIRDAIGRDTKWYYVASSIPCSGCDLDYVTNTSKNSFCNICSGLYWIPVYGVSTIKAHITWGKLDTLNWVTGGQFFDGDCRVQIKYTDENITIVDNVKWVEVDGKKLEVKNKIFRGVPQLNRIIVDLVEIDNNP